MYGGQVLLDSNNIATFLRFSVQFEISELLNLCAVWMESNNLYRESERILNETDKSRSLDIIGSINFKKISVYENSINRNSLSSEEEEHIDLAEICSSFAETTIETRHTNGHTATVVSSRGRGRLAAELSTLASPASALDVGKHSNNGHQINKDLPSGLPKSDRQGEWQKVPLRSAPEPKIKNEAIYQNPVTNYKPNLSKWSQFSTEELLRLGSSLCPYPEFAKLEVAIAWLANSELTHHQCQSLFNQFAENIDPLNLSDRYISLLSDYTKSWNVSFPQHFNSHIRNCYVPDDPKSNSKYFMHLWTLQRGDLAELKEFQYVSFFAPCPLCDKGTGETVLKLVKQTPCYDLKIDLYRRKKQKHGIVYPVHFHSNTVFHWVIKTGSGSRPILHSLVTCSLQTLMNILNKHDRLIVSCLQLKSK